MRKKFFQDLYKEYGAAGLAFLVILVFFLGGVGALFVERTVLPRLSTWPVFRNFQTFQPSQPVVITKREEVRIVEGINQQETASKVKDGLVLVYLHTEKFDSGEFRVDSAISGAVVTSDGIVMVPTVELKPGFQLTVLTQSGEAYPARLVASDTLTGISLLKTEADNLQVLRTGFSEDLAAGERILAVFPGENLTNPALFSLALSERPVVRPSLISVYPFQTLNVTLETGPPLGEAVVGSAVVSKDAQLVGFVTEIQERVVIVRAEDTRAMINNYLDDQQILWPRLNLTYQFFAQTQTSLFGLSKQTGILIKQAPASLQPDDFVFAVDGVQITEREGFQELILNKPPGSTVKLSLIRDGTEREVEVGL